MSYPWLVGRYCLSSHTRITYYCYSISLLLLLLFHMYSSIHSDNLNNFMNFPSFVILNIKFHTFMHSNVQEQKQTHKFCLQTIFFRSLLDNREYLLCLYVCIAFCLMYKFKCFLFIFIHLSCRQGKLKEKNCLDGLLIKRSINQILFQFDPPACCSFHQITHKLPSFNGNQYSSFYITNALYRCDQFFFSLAFFEQLIDIYMILIDV